MSGSEFWTVRSLLKWATEWLGRKGIEGPRLDGELLLAQALGMPRLNLFLDPDRPLSAEELAAFKVLIKRRAAREPVAYILGRRGFWSLDLTLSPGVLIPRPETETLVEAVLARRPDRDAALTFLELGVGSGAIALSLLTEYPHAHAVATDISPAPLACAEANARRLGLAARLTLRSGDLFAALAPGDGPFDLIVSNPPYVADAEREALTPEITLWEPPEALFGGFDGADVLRPLVAGAGGFLKPGGLLAVEIGASQGPAVQGLMVNAGLVGVKTLPDHGRRDRVVVALQQKPPP